MVQAVVVAAAAALLSYLLTHGAIQVLPRFGLLSARDPNHRDPVPVGGGVVVWAVVVAAFLTIVALGHAVVPVGKIMLGATLLFLAGLWDDARFLAPRTKVLVQVIAATLVIIGGVSFPLGPGLEWVAVPLTLLWFVGLCNAFNLIDNMDGMLPGVAAIAAVFTGLFAFATGRVEIGLLSWAVAGASLGFLRHNLPPAKILLGDSGSMFLGFLLAGLTIGGSWTGMTQVGLTILVPALLLAVPIFNTTFVTITRKISGVPVSRGKADHINYRLLAHGMSRTRALGAVYVLSIVAGALGLLVMTITPLAYAAGSILFLVVLLYLGVFLYGGRVRQNLKDFEVEQTGSGWEQSPWYRWVIRVIAVSGDVLLVFTALYAAFYLRFEGQIPGDQLRNLTTVLPYLILIRVGLGLMSGVYETRWGLASAPDALRLIRTVFLGSLVFSTLVLLLRVPSFPRSVLVIEGALTMILLAGTRLSVRGLGEMTARERSVREGKRTIVAGSADGVLAVYQGILARKDGEYHVIGFVYDDPLAHRSLVAGVRVLGPMSKLRALSRLARAEHVILALPTGPDDRIEARVQGLMRSGLTAEVVRLEIVAGDAWLNRGGRAAGDPSVDVPKVAPRWRRR